MKLFRHGPAGSEHPGAIDGYGALRDISAHLTDLTPEWLAPPKLQELARIDLARCPLVTEGTRIAAPVGGIRQFICIGLNYRRHAEEAGQPIPEEPVVFNKALGSIGGPNDDIVLPLHSTSTDWEVELGFFIGTTARQVAEERALEHVAGYCLANDVSEREWQLKRSGQWMKGKSFDGFGPVGPWLVTRDEVPNAQAIPLSLKVNGVMKQRSSTADQIFPVARIVSYLSQFMTLSPGDLVITGTPEGVGLGSKPSVFLQDGDVMELDGGPLGRQRQRVRAAQAVERR